jgi:hypothetical protein
LAEIFQHPQLFDGAVKATIATVAFVGLREGEVRGLWGTADTGTISIFGGLFPSSLEGPIDLSNLADRSIEPALRKVGLNWYGWHAYGMGLASNLKELGVDDLVIQQILRHGDVDTTRKSYIKVGNVKVEDAIRQLRQAFEACTALV